MRGHPDLPRPSGRRCLAGAAAGLALLGACKQPPASRVHADPAAAARGLDAIRSAGCAACHEIPGVDWPRGRTGPSLRGFDDVGLIAGELPNTPANLAAFVRNAPLAKAGSTMPAMPLTSAEARDVAAYLHAIDDE
nr:c-type cytochrome [Altererythrobacter sp. B11]